MSKKNRYHQKITTFGYPEYVSAPDLEGVRTLTVPAEGDDRLAKVRERHASIRPPVTRWVDHSGSLVVQDNYQGTKTLTRQCPECSRWFKVVRGAIGNARWPKTCHDERCKIANRRKVDAERQRRKRERDKKPQVFWLDGITCDTPGYDSDMVSELLARNEVTERDGVIYRDFSPEGRAIAEASLREYEEWEEWGSRTPPTWLWRGTSR